MRAAVILLWGSCLYSLARSVLCLFWAASPWRRVLMLAILATTLACSRSPEEMRENRH